MVPFGGLWVRRPLAFLGPVYLVSVGYMDPGNWATDLAGGSIVTNPEMLYIAIGIIGATVMPHHLYLHSSIVQTRPDRGAKREAVVRDFG